MARSAGFEPATLCLEAGFQALLPLTNMHYYLRYSMVLMMSLDLRKKIDP